MSETVLNALDAAGAEKLLRHLEPTEALEAGILTPMAGTRPIRLFSLEEAERFLVVHDGKAVDLGGAWATVNYVDPAQLATWIGDTLGDRELADGMQQIASSRKPYGFLVPDMKALLSSRMEQARQLLGVAEAPAE